MEQLPLSDHLAVGKRHVGATLLQTSGDCIHVAFYHFEPDSGVVALKAGNGGWQKGSGSGGKTRKPDDPA